MVIHPYGGRWSKNKKSKSKKRRAASPPDKEEGMEEQYGL